MKKLIENGKVAVLYTNEYGSTGWFSINKKYPACLFSLEIVALVKQKDADEISARDRDQIINQIKEKAVKLFGPDFNTDGASDLGIEWIDQGSLFRVEINEGNEIIKYSDEVWFKA